MKKTMISLLIFCLLITLNSCSPSAVKNEQTSTPNVTATVTIPTSVATDDQTTGIISLSKSDQVEVEGALERGLVNQEMLDDLLRPITRGEMATITKNCVIYLGKEPDANLLSLSNSKDTQGITRDAASVIISDAMLESLGIEQTNGTPQEYDHGKASIEDSKDPNKYYSWVVGQFDLTSGLPVMELDGNFSFRSNEKMTVLDAVKAVWRLSNSIMPESDYVEIDSLTEQLTFSDDLITQAKSMPELDPKNLHFHGIDIGNKSSDEGSPYGSPSMFVEPDVMLIKDIGFNFIRVPLSYKLIVNPDVPTQINLVHLKNIDQLVAWGMKYKIHICLSLFLWDGDQYSTVAPSFWNMLANRYINVPDSVLSFNILNEPYSIENQNALISLYDNTINIIRSYSPNRLIFVDSLKNDDESYYQMNSGWYPLDEMVGKNVVLAYHSYDPETVLGTLGGYPPQDSWPFPFVNDKLASVANGGSPIIINGNFQKGTKINVNVSYVGGRSSLLIKLDGTDIYQASLDKIASKNAGIDNEVELTSGGEKIEIFAVGDWIKIASITLVYNQPSTTPVPYFGNDWVPESYSSNKITNIITSRVDAEGFRHNEIVVNQDGTYKTVGDGMLQYDKQYFEEKIGIWKNFSENNNVGVMLQELTMYSQHPTQNLYLGLLDDYLTVMDENGLSWSTWDWERLIQTHHNYNESNTTWIKMGVHYVNKELLQVLQKHLR